jgi:peptidoglycan L-alanyl-D-glutamate endopeptidase CwlK
MTQLFDSRSVGELVRTHPDLVKVLMLARGSIAFTVIQSTRSEADQEKAFNTGHSKAHWGQSSHDYNPALGVDVIPIPLDWNDIESFRKVSVVIKAAGSTLNIPVTWGGTWSIRDYPHFELSDWKQRKNK